MAKVINFKMSEHSSEVLNEQEIPIEFPTLRIHLLYHKLVFKGIQLLSDYVVQRIDTQNDVEQSWAKKLIRLTNHLRQMDKKFKEEITESVHFHQAFVNVQDLLQRLFPFVKQSSPRKFQFHTPLSQSSLDKISIGELTMIDNIIEEEDLEESFDPNRTKLIKQKVVGDRIKRGIPRSYANQQISKESTEIKRYAKRAENSKIGELRTSKSAMKPKLGRDISQEITIDEQSSAISSQHTVIEPINRKKCLYPLANPEILDYISSKSKNLEPPSIAAADIKITTPRSRNGVRTTRSTQQQQYMTQQYPYEVNSELKQAAQMFPGIQQNSSFTKSKPPTTVCSEKSSNLNNSHMDQPVIKVQGDKHYHYNTNNIKIQMVPGTSVMGCEGARLSTEHLLKAASEQQTDSLAAQIQRQFQNQILKQRLIPALSRHTNYGMDKVSSNPLSKQASMSSDRLNSHYHIPMKEQPLDVESLKKMFVSNPSQIGTSSQNTSQRRLVPIAVNNNQQQKRYFQIY
ncbi:hypothetical protein FGO68_gene2042 [Halteria grandinella]|uniref:Uncharacterized protein n=1 Tax=Halteria grandinella TaxID=5974 RepID=A0A8J8T2H0_HALGN|nr:hypothetical protein FGO68_gene2042 [Halteria grandinella]